MRAKLIYAIALPLVLIGLMSYVEPTVATGQRPGPQADVAEIQQPPGWASFEADFEQRDEAGNVTLVGKYYRSADGSDRFENGDGVHTIITIKSIPLAKMFVYGPNPAEPKADSGWIWRSYRMDLPEGGWHPLRYRLNAHVTKNEERIEGMETYEMTIPEKGNRVLMAPDLNFFRVLEDLPNAGVKRVYRNIKKGDPPSRLFLPPPDATVHPQEKVLGIRRMKNPK